MADADALAAVARVEWAVRMRLETGVVYYESVRDESAAQRFAANPPLGWKVSDLVPVSRVTATTEWEEQP